MKAVEVTGSGSGPITLTDLQAAEAMLDTDVGFLLLPSGVIELERPWVLTKPCTIIGTAPVVDQQGFQEPPAGTTIRLKQSFDWDGGRFAIDLTGQRDLRVHMKGVIVEGELVDASGRPLPPEAGSEQLENVANPPTMATSAVLFIKGRNRLENVLIRNVRGRPPLSSGPRTPIWAVLAESGQAFNLQIGHCDVGLQVGGSDGRTLFSNCLFSNCSQGNVQVVQTGDGGSTVFSACNFDESGGGAAVDLAAAARDVRFESCLFFAGGDQFAIQERARNTVFSACRIAPFNKNRRADGRDRTVPVIVTEGDQAVGPVFLGCHIGTRSEAPTAFHFLLNRAVKLIACSFAKLTAGEESPLPEPLLDPRSSNPRPVVV